MASDEILLKVALDLDKASSEFKDFTSLWEKHYSDVKKGDDAMKKHGDNTAKAYDSLNKKIKENITQVGNEGKAYEDLGKKVESLNKKNKESFDPKQLEAFIQTLNKAKTSLGHIQNLDMSMEDMDNLSKKLANTKDEFETLNVLVDFFNDKMKSSASTAGDSFEVLNQKVEETKLNIKETESYLKEIDKQIKTTAPGQGQANLIQEREAAKNALAEEKVALADYEAQVKKARIENVSMTTQLRRVKEELIQLELAGERGGDRWNQLSEDAKKYNTAIRDTNAELLRTSKSTAGLDNLIGAATGVVAFFTAAQGAAALFGQENEDLQKSLVKLTGAIALLNGMQQIQLELSKKGTIANKALTFVQTQYATATNASATATMRLVAASKLLGIGLIIGGLTYLVSNWKDIAKWIGITSERTERFNAINKTANDTYGEQIAKLKILSETVKKGGLSFDEKNKAVKDFNESLGDSLGSAKDYEELEKRLIDNSDNYIKYLQLKAKAEAAYRLQVEATMLAMRTRNEVEEAGIREFVKAIFGDKTPDQYAKEAANKEADKIQRTADKYGEEYEKIKKEQEELAAAINIVGDKPKEKLTNDIKAYTTLLEDFVKKSKDLKNSLIENDREREKSIITDQLNDEKEKYKKQIEALKVNNEKKLELLEAYNAIYNEETGKAYEQYRKTIAKIDAKYDAQTEEIRFKSLSAIAEVYDTSEQLEREAIGKKWDGIRKELEDQIKLTNDDLKKQELTAIITYSFEAEKQDLTNFDLDKGLDRVDREKQIADSILKIYQTNARDIIDNEEIKQLQLLKLDKQYLDNVLNVYKNSLKSIEDQGLFDSLIKTLETSVDVDEIEEAGKKLREAFGDTTADEILNTVAALREVSQGIEDIGTKTNFEKLIDDFGKWTNSIESFSLQLAKSLGFQGKAAQEFASGIATAIESTWFSLQTIFDAEIDQHRQKINSFQESINAIESELERERKLYEDGYANNYDERQKDLENLIDQKKKEEEELEKAQKKKAMLARAELVIDTVSQLQNLITASSNIFKWASKIPIVGVPLAIGLITTMFGAFAIAKTKAYQAIGQGQNFRKGLREGSLKLSGPRHEEKGFGLFNSKTGERVAEFEDGEEILISNRQQSRKYRHILDALIADAQGRADIDSTLEGYYGVRQVGKQTMQVVKHVNNISIKAQKSKEEASSHNDSLLKEFKDFKESFKREFDGYKNERDDEIESWETPHFFYVKKGNTIKKYPKKDIG